MRSISASLRDFIYGVVSAAIGPFRLASLLTVCYWGAIFIGTHMPVSGVGMPRVSDKLMHFAAFAGLALLLAWAIPTRPRRRMAHLKLTAGIALVYGVVDECSQALVPGRSPDIRDYAADVAGIVAGLAIYTVLRYLLTPSDSRGRTSMRILADTQRQQLAARVHADCSSTDHDSINVA